MTGPVIIFTGPEAPDGAKFCDVCSQIYKFYAIKTEAVASALAYVQSGKIAPGEVFEIGLPKPDEIENLPCGLQLAVARSVYPPLAQQFGPALYDLCWSHLMSLQVTEGILPASAGALDGLSGPVELSQSAARQRRG